MATEYMQSHTTEMRIKVTSQRCMSPPMCPTTDTLGYRLLPVDHFLFIHISLVSVCSDFFVRKINVLCPHFHNSFRVLT